MGLYISRRHHARVMAKLDQLARQVMRADPEASSPTLRNVAMKRKLQRLVAPDRFGLHDTPQSISIGELFVRRRRWMRML
jgi:hypothetical protein